MLIGLNHLTLTAADLLASIAFCHDLLGFRLEARWDQGAYLELGSLWLYLSRESQYGGPVADYTYYTFGVAAADFAHFAAQLRAYGVHEWKQNHSEGDSFYFLDPDGHRLEAHVGGLRNRLAVCRQAPYAGMRFADQALVLSEATDVTAGPVRRSSRRGRLRSSVPPRSRRPSHKPQPRQRSLSSLSRSGRSTARS